MLRDRVRNATPYPPYPPELLDEVVLTWELIFELAELNLELITLDAEDSGEVVLVPG